MIIKSHRNGESFNIDAYTFICTCRSVPEQYDVYADGVLIFYVRLRYGRLTANRYIDGEIDFDNPFYAYADFEPLPNFKGDFEDNEREPFLRLIIKSWEESTS